MNAAKGRGGGQGDGEGHPALTADLTGLGDDEGAFDVGLQQGAGIGLGLVLIVVGLVLVRRNQTKEM
jgi:hypothetical protein